MWYKMESTFSNYIKITLVMLYLNLHHPFLAAAAPQPCHTNSTNNGSLANAAKLAEIDDALTSLYSNIKTNAEYMENCTYTITASGEDIELTLILERFEVLRSNYEQGFWGYCGDDGVVDLLGKIKEVETLATTMELTICDRDQLLNCDGKYERCLCLFDNRNFRNIASNFWNNSVDAVEDPKKSLGRDQCVLVTGSDCPISPESSFLCIPGTNCLFKNDLTPCVPQNSNSSGTTRTIFRRRRRQTNSTNSTNPQAAGYSIINDMYPTVHCQCYDFERRINKSSKISSATLAVFLVLLLPGFLSKSGFI